MPSSNATSCCDRPKSGIAEARKEGRPQTVAEYVGYARVSTQDQNLDLGITKPTLYTDSSGIWGVRITI